MPPAIDDLPSLTRANFSGTHYAQIVAQVDSQIFDLRACQLSGQDQVLVARAVYEILFAVDAMPGISTEQLSRTVAEAVYRELAGGPQ